MAVERIDSRRGLGVLLRELAEGSAALVRGEIRLARVEVAAALAGIRTGTLLVATGSVLALLGGLSLLAGIVLLVGDQWLPHDLYWVAALVIMMIAGTIALWFAKRAMALLSPAALAPNETVTTLKEDTEWLKQRLTSGATSS
jgi:uncharacterized membrane protein YqjE